MNYLISYVFCIICPGDSISPRRKWFRAASVFSGLFSHRRESSFAPMRVQSPRRESPWSKCALMSVFTQARRYSCPGESIFAHAKMALRQECSLTIFAQSINFRSGENVFSPGGIGLVQPNKKK